MKERRILVFPGGTEIGLEIWNALKDLTDILLFSVGIDTPNHATFVFKYHEIIPSVNTADWLEALNKTIAKWQIDYIFPAHDDVLVALKKNENRISALIITSPLETVLTTRSKSKTYSCLKKVVQVPHQYNLDNVPCFPVFVKPDKGQGSLNAVKINSFIELYAYFKTVTDGIILEYLPGKEYTIDCFSTRKEGLLFCRGRERIRVRAGISMTSHSITNRNFRCIAENIASQLTFYGAWFFQLKEAEDGELTLLEVAPRISGTMAVHRMVGINFPLLSIYEAEGIPVSILENPYDVKIDRALVNRFCSNMKYEYIYVELNFLILRNKLNITVIRFLYQCFNNNKKIILLIRDEGNIEEIFSQFAISKNLFSKIIKIEKSMTQSKYISEQKAIFLGDCFQKRKEIQEQCGIPTFDSSMIELLFDEKV